MVRIVSKIESQGIVKVNYTHSDFEGYSNQIELMKAIEAEYASEGYIIEFYTDFCGSIYKMNWYTVSEEMQKQHSLWTRNRVHGVKVSGENGADEIDYAVISR